MDNLQQLLVAFGTVVGFAWAVFERVRSNKAAINAEIISGKDAIIQVERDRANAIEERLTEQRKEYAEYRKETHERLDKAHEQSMVAAKQIAELQAKTDLTAVMDKLQSRDEFDAKMLQQLEILTSNTKATAEILQKLLNRDDKIS